MKVVLGYSGSLDTSAAIRLLAAQPGTSVVALILDLGQDRDLQQLRTQAISLGDVLTYGGVVLVVVHAMRRRDEDLAAEPVSGGIARAEG